jgi:phosphatidylglycerophosphate synthase
MAGAPQPTGTSEGTTAHPRTAVTAVFAGSVRRLRDLVARGLLAVGVTPNQLTVLGLLFSAAGGVTFALGLWDLRLGALCIVTAGACDILDGAVAKMGGRTTPFGAMLDSSLDRYSDGFLIGGLIVHWAAGGQTRLVVLALSALVGSLAVSYTRARAENVIPSCKVGFWERGERSVLLLLAAVTGTLPAAMLVLGTLAHLTALQRILHTRRVLAGEPDRPPVGGVRRVGRWLVHKVIFWGYPRTSLAYDLVSAVTVAFVLLIPFQG